MLRVCTLLPACLAIAACNNQPRPPATTHDAAPSPTASHVPPAREEPAPAAHSAPDSPAVQPAVSVPAWWLDRPLEEGGFASVCASADDQSMIAARAAALAAARDVLAKLTTQPAIDHATKIEAAPVPGGGFRAFVRLTARK